MPKNTNEHTVGHSSTTTEHAEDRTDEFTDDTTERYEEKRSASEHFSAALQEADGNLAQEVAQVYDRNTDTRSVKGGAKVDHLDGLTA